MTRVVLIDDHELIRQGLRRAFERSHDFAVVGEGDTIAAGLALVEDHAPDVIVIDVRLPDGSGIDAVKKLRCSHAQLGIVVVTMYGEDEVLFTAMRAGASAFVAKDRPADDVLAAARHAAASPARFTAYDLAGALQRRSSDVRPQLSQREGQVLRLLADGMSAPTVAKQLFIGESTAKTHISRVYEKLGANNRAQALMTALKHGLITQSN
ncbi:MAG: DNA-binding response regulator [Frankiales bacterium]|nr:DNA-binding response regulator [Frankiales bacterium]